MPEPFIDWLAIINLLGVVQGIFLAVVFFTVKKGNKTANHLLGFLMLVLAFLVFEIFLGYTAYIQYVPFLINLEEPLGFLIGPISYFYTLALLHPDFRFKWKWQGLHLLPFFLQLLGRIPFFLQSNAYKIQDTALVFHQQIDEWIPPRKILYFPEHNFLVSTWLDIATQGLIFTYQAYSIWLIYRHLKQRNESLWNPSDASLRWLIRTLSLFLVFLISIAYFSFTSEDDVGDIYIALASSVVFYCLSFYLVIDLQASVSDKPQKQKYENSVLDKAMATDIRQKLEDCMTSEKPYLNNELTMPQLAEQIKASPHHLSQVINEQFGQNFSDFINQHRIEEMKGRLKSAQYQHLKIEQIAFDTGFNSKSTFQSAFKKFTGLTPSQYRKNYQESI